MAQVDDLIGLLKRELRRKGITYARIAQALHLSESSIKRMFASSNFSLKRLEQICDLAGLELGDLVGLADEKRRDIELLSEQQEQTLVGNGKLLLMAFLLLNHWSVEQILASYDIEELEAVQLLALLDRLKIIDLLPGNKVRVRLSRTFSWRPNGPIQRLFENQVQAEFFRSRFDGPGELRLVLNGMISDESIRLLQQKMKRLVTEFEQCVREDRRTVSVERLGTTMFLAIRPWAVKMFEDFRRRQPAATGPRRE